MLLLLAILAADARSCDIANYDAGRSAIDHAIESSTESMHWPTKGIARRRLAAKNELARHVDLASEGERVVITFDGDRRYATPADGTAVDVELPDNEHVRLSQRAIGEGFEQHFVSKDGERTNVFTPTEDGLRLDVTVKSGRLPEPVHYEIDYRCR